MRHVTRHTIVPCFALAFLVGLWGCATPRYTVSPLPSEEVKGTIGSVGVVVSETVSAESHLEGPTSGKGSGAAKGFLGCIAAGGRSGDAGALGFAIAISPFCAMYGAIAAESAGKVQDAEAILNKGVADWNINETIRDGVFQIAHKETQHPFVLMTEQGPDARDAVVTAGGEPDTILEVGVARFGLEGEGINPPLPLFVTAHARLVRVADGTEIYAASWTYRSRSRKFLEWAANNAQPLRAELDRAIQTLAEVMVEELFLLYRIPEPEEN